MSRTKRLDYVVYHRHAAVAEGDWFKVMSSRTLSGARDELASWQGPRLDHGDLVRVIGANHDSLYVFSELSSELVSCQKRVSVPDWEGHRVSAWGMVQFCSKYDVDLRRLVMAACDCAATTFGFVPEGDGRARAAVEAARAWCAGGSADGLRAARDAARDASNIDYNPDDTRARHTLEADAAADACDSAAYAAEAAMRAAGGGREARGRVTTAAGFAVYDAADCGTHTRANRRDAIAAQAQRDELLVAMAPLIRRHIPLSVIACASVGLRDPLPLFAQHDGGEA